MYIDWFLLIKKINKQIKEREREREYMYVRIFPQGYEFISLLLVFISILVNFVFVCGRSSLAQSCCSLEEAFRGCQVAFAESWGTSDADFRSLEENAVDEIPPGWSVLVEDAWTALDTEYPFSFSFSVPSSLLSFCLFIF